MNLRAPCALYSRTIDHDANPTPTQLPLHLHSNNNTFYKFHHDILQWICIPATTNKTSLGCIIIHTSSSTTSNKKSGPILPNDKIVIFGGTGGVGQLVTRKLLARTNKSYKVTVVARNVESAKEVLTSPNDDDDNDDGELNLNVVQLNLVGENKATPDELKVAMDGASGIVISVGTTAFPTKKWNNGNNPRAIDDEAVARIASVAADIPTLRRIV